MNVQPYILLINNTTLAPFVRNGDVVQFGHKFTDFNDLIGEKTNAWPVIIEYLKHDGVKKLEFENVREHSQTVEFFKNYLLENPEKGTITSAKTAPNILLPKTFDEYIASIHEKRKKYRKFERDFPQAEVITSDDHARDVDILIQLMKKNIIKLNSFTPEKEAFFRSIAVNCKQHIRIFMLRINNEIIASQIMFLSGKTVMVYISGYDREKYPSVGTYLIMKAIKQAIEEGYEEFDLLIGREQYKYELGAYDFPLYTITLDL